MLGVAPETLRLWESGHGIDRDALILIADATGAGLQWLIAGLTPSQVEAIYSATRAAKFRSSAEPTIRSADM